MRKCSANSSFKEAANEKISSELFLKRSSQLKKGQRTLPLKRLPVRKCLANPSFKEASSEKMSVALFLRRGSSEKMYSVLLL